MKYKLGFIIVIFVNLFTSCNIMRMPCDLVGINTNDAPKPYVNNYNYQLSVPAHYVPAYIVGPEDNVVYSYVYRYKKQMCINIGTVPYNSENFEEQYYDGSIEPLIFQGNKDGLYWKTAIMFKHLDDRPILFYIEYANIPIEYLSLFDESLVRTIALQKTK